MGSAKNTTALLQKLRALMCDASYITPPINAYIVPSGDAHLSEYTSDCDERRAFISGFNGSAGTAVITEKKAALWTDGRYYLQAAAQIDNNWTLMKDGLPDTPTQAEWLIRELPARGRVGVDPLLMAEGVWDQMSKRLAEDELTLVPVARNLVDAVWDNKPERSTRPAFIHPLRLTGMEWWQKVEDVRKKMTEKSSSVMIVSNLDEIAWLLNLRGSDISHTPVFFSFLLLTVDQEIILCIDERKMTADVTSHLKHDKVKVVVKTYESVISELKSLIDRYQTGKIWAGIIYGFIRHVGMQSIQNIVFFCQHGGKIQPASWPVKQVSDKTNFALVDAVPKNRRLNEQLPIPLMKAIKNDVELNGMRQAHIKDAVALCEFFCWLENEIKTREVSEIEAAEKSEEFRKQQEDYVSLSFETISSFGSNGSIIHYKPSVETNKMINNKEIFLLDSGAQFRDGTTDVTRTVHLGTPTAYEKECFTRVLKGHIQLGSLVFPNNVKGLFLDSFARQYLWSAGLDYLHGTGHGVGSFLGVHEGPCGIGFRIRIEDVPLQKRMILSNEPGYYEDNKFGIRIESLVEIVDAKTTYNYKNKGFLTFDTITLVPIQVKMIDASLLTKEEIEWFNSYHEKCVQVIGAELQKQGRKQAYDWLIREAVKLPTK